MNIEYIKNYPRYCIISNLTGDGGEYEYFKSKDEAERKFYFYSANLALVTRKILNESYIHQCGDKLSRVWLIHVDSISNLELPKLLEASNEKDFRYEWESVVMLYGKTILHAYSYYLDDTSYHNHLQIGVKTSTKDEDDSDDFTWLVEREMYKIDDLK